MAARFRTDILPPAPGAPVAEVLAALPPPVPLDATPPTIGAETVPTTAPTPPPVASTPPRLLDDSVASDAARAEPAAPPSIEPATLVGATATMLRDRFGGPESQTPIGSGVSWHYVRAACKASFVLLPELNSGALRVFSYEITPREGAMFGPAGCLGRIAATREARAAETVQ